MGSHSDPKLFFEEKTIINSGFSVIYLRFHIIKFITNLCFFLASTSFFTHTRRYISYKNVIRWLILGRLCAHGEMF